MSEVDSFTLVSAASVSIVGSDYIQQVGGPTTSTVKGSIELISWGCDECRWAPSCSFKHSGYWSDPILLDIEGIVPFHTYYILFQGINKQR